MGWMWMNLSKQAKVREANTIGQALAAPETGRLVSPAHSVASDSQWLGER
jgi:hypothetical protein